MHIFRLRMDTKLSSRQIIRSRDDLSETFISQSENPGVVPKRLAGVSQMHDSTYTSEGRTYNILALHFLS